MQYRITFNLCTLVYLINMCVFSFNLALTSYLILCVYHFLRFKNLKKLSSNNVFNESSIQIQFCIISFLFQGWKPLLWNSNGSVHHCAIPTDIDIWQRLTRTQKSSHISSLFIHKNHIDHLDLPDFLAGPLLDSITSGTVRGERRFYYTITSIPEDVRIVWGECSPVRTSIGH